MSFYDVTFQTETWVGLGNYVDLLLKNPEYWQTLLHTVWFTLGSVVTHLLLGMALALLLHSRINILARNVFRGLLIVPWSEPATGFLPSCRMPCKRTMRTVGRCAFQRSRS